MPTITLISPLRCPLWWYLHKPEQVPECSMCRHWQWTQNWKANVLLWLQIWIRALIGWSLEAVWAAPEKGGTLGDRELTDQWVMSHHLTPIHQIAVLEGHPVCCPQHSTTCAYGGTFSALYRLCREQRSLGLGQVSGIDSEACGTVTKIRPWEDGQRKVHKSRGTQCAPTCNTRHFTRGALL